MGAVGRDSASFVTCDLGGAITAHRRPLLCIRSSINVDRVGVFACVLASHVCGTVGVWRESCPREEVARRIHCLRVLVHYRLVHHIHRSSPDVPVFQSCETVAASGHGQNFAKDAHHDLASRSAHGGCCPRHYCGPCHVFRDRNAVFFGYQRVWVCRIGMIAWIAPANTLWPRYSSEDDNFNSFPDAMLAMYILTTTENFPTVMCACAVDFV